MIKKILLAFLFLFTLVMVIVGKLTAWLFRRTRDAGQEAYQSVKNADSFSQAYQNYASDKFAKSRLSMPEEIIALMAKIASSDGKVSSLEVEYMSDTIKAMVSGMQNAGVPQGIIERTKSRLFSLANEAKSDDRPIQYYTEALSKSPLEVRTGAFMQIIGFSMLDGMGDNTQTMLQHIGIVLKFGPSEIEQIIEKVMGAMAGNASYDPQKDPYEVLGCQETDDMKVIKVAYRRLVKQHHPDYMHGKGMDEQAIQEATEMMQEINTAYDEIKRRKSV